MGSTRLPGKVLLHLGEARILARMVFQVNQASALDSVVVTTGDGPENEAIVEWCRRNDVPYDIGPGENLLERHFPVARDTDCELLVRITGDCPFAPPAGIDRLVQEHQENSSRYTTIVVDEMPVGPAVDVIDGSVLQELRDAGEVHPVRLLRSEPSEWQVEFSRNRDWAQTADAHIAVDSPSDYWLLTDAVNETDGSPASVASWIAGR